MLRLNMDVGIFKKGIGRLGRGLLIAVLFLDATRQSSCHSGHI